MKLPDFTLDVTFNALRKQMGAELVELVQEDPVWQNLIIRLQEEGIDVPFEEVDIQPDSTFTYKGQKVIVYIRDQYGHIVELRGGYKFHLAHCDTLEKMARDKRYGRYVVTNRKDGKFIVNLIRKDSNDRQEGLELALAVCKNCLTTLTINGVIKPGVTSKTFKLDDFFENHESQIKRRPQYTDKTAPINDYPPNWTEIANERKAAAKYTCQDCGKSCISQKKMLHVHHIDGLKYNNSSQNLRVLCVSCHADQPGHEHMRATIFYEEPAELLVAERATTVPLT